MIARNRGRVKPVSRLVGSSAKPTLALFSVAISRDFEISSSGRASRTPSRSLSRAIAASPAMPLPRSIRINSVSAWSSRVCAVRICVAPCLRAACASRRYRAARAAAGNPVFGLAPVQRRVWCGRSSDFASRLTSRASRAASARKP